MKTSDLPFTQASSHDPTLTNEQTQFPILGTIDSSERVYAKLEGQGIHYYMRSLDIQLGRKYPDRQYVDVPLTNYSDISRYHAHVYYNKKRKRFELLVNGMKGVTIQNVKFPRGSSVPLKHNSTFQIGDVHLKFILPHVPEVVPFIEFIPKKVKVIARRRINGSEQTKELAPEEDPRQLSVRKHLNQEESETQVEFDKKITQETESLNKESHNKAQSIGKLLNENPRHTVQSEAIIEILAVSEKILEDVCPESSKESDNTAQTMKLLNEMSENTAHLQLEESIETLAVLEKRFDSDQPEQENKANDNKKVVSETVSCFERSNQMQQSLSQLKQRDEILHQETSFELENNNSLYDPKDKNMIVDGYTKANSQIHLQGTEFTTSLFDSNSPMSEEMMLDELYVQEQSLSFISKDDTNSDSSLSSQPNNQGSFIDPCETNHKYINIKDLTCENKFNHCEETEQLLSNGHNFTGTNISVGHKRGISDSEEDSIAKKPKLESEELVSEKDVVSISSAIAMSLTSRPKTHIPSLGIPELIKELSSMNTRRESSHLAEKLHEKVNNTIRMHLLHPLRHPLSPNVALLLPEAVKFLPKKCVSDLSSSIITSLNMGNLYITTAVLDAFNIPR